VEQIVVLIKDSHHAADSKDRHSIAFHTAAGAVGKGGKLQPP